MNPARHKELLGRLFESELSGGEAEELAGGINASPALRRDLRQHLVLWELWSQSHAPERSAEAFVRAWKTRLRAETEAPGAFAGQVRKQLQPAGPMGACRDVLRALMRRPAPIAWATSFVIIALVALFWFAAPTSSHATTTIKGEAVCTACVLHESHDHIPVIRVTDHGVTRNYYLDRNAAVSGLQNYFCSGPAPVSAEGKVRTEKGRLLFEAHGITIPDAHKPPMTNDTRIIFPI